VSIIHSSNQEERKMAEIQATASTSGIAASMSQQFAEQAQQQLLVQSLAARSQQEAHNRTLIFQSSSEIMKNSFDCIKDAIKNGAKTQ